MSLCISPLRNRVVIYSSFPQPHQWPQLPFKYENKLMLENQVSTTRSLLNLAREVLIKILSYLPAANMIAVQHTCRTIRDIVSGTAYLQYTLHAEINGVADLLPPDFPYSERLKLQRCHEQSWRDLRFNLFAEPHRIPDGLDRASFTLQDGYLIYRCLSWGRNMRYGYTDLYSADRNKELRWVHLTTVESHHPDNQMTPTHTLYHSHHFMESSGGLYMGAQKSWVITS